MKQTQRADVNKCKGADRCWHMPWLTLSMVLAILATSVNMALKAHDVPKLWPTSKRQWYVSLHSYYQPSGQVTHVEDYQTLHFQLFFNYPSHTSRTVVGETDNIHFSYLMEFHREGLLRFTDLTVHGPLSGVEKLMGIEMHALHRLSDETMQIIHFDGNVLCYVKTLEGGIKCGFRRH